MTNAITPTPPQDFQKKCKQVERDHEARKLLFLLDKVKRQIAQRENSEARVESPKPPVPIDSHSGLPGRPAVFER